jgi:hypothetical protein
MTTLSSKSDQKVQVHVFITDKEKTMLDTEALSKNMSRSALIREKLRQHSFEMKRGSAVYSAAVEAACRVYSGIPRSAMESVVAAVICSLDGGRSNY